MMAIELSIGAKFMYGLLLMFAWQENECFPGQERLAVVAEISVRQVQRYLFELRDYGLITWRRRGQNQTNVYYIKDLKTVERLKMPDMTNMSGPDATNMSCPDTTCMSHKEYSDQNKVVVVDPNPAVEKIPNDESARSSTVESDSAASVFPAAVAPAAARANEAGPVEAVEKPGWEKIREEVREVSGADISPGFAREIAEKYPWGKVNAALNELRRQLSTGAEIRGVGAWLRSALERDFRPDQPAVKTAKAKDPPGGDFKSGNNNRTPRARPRSRPESSYTMTPEQERRKKEFIRSLYQ